MNYRFAVWASATAVVGAMALAGCGSDETPGGTAAPGVGVTPSAGTAVASGGTGATPAAGRAAAGTTGAATNNPPARAGGTGASGTSAAPASGGTSATASTAGTGSSPTPSASGAGGSSTAAPTAGTGAAAPGSAETFCGGPNMNAPEMLDKMGPLAPMHIERTGPSGSSWIFFPANLMTDEGKKWPTFDWGPGAGTGPDSYVDHLNLLASNGFVVISQASTQSGMGALDWILAENEKSGSMFYQKLDTARVGRGGHSMGALQSFSESADPRLTLYVLVCGGGSGTGGAANIHAPSVFLGGEGEGGTVNFEGDYAAIKTSPSYFVTKTDTDHIYCARNNLAPWVAFMRMTWCGDQQYQKELLDGGAFCKSPWLACKSKNL